MFSEITSRLAVASAYDDLPSGWHTLDVRGMIDGPGNSRALVDDYVGEGIRILDQPDTKLLVVCDYGQSRSNVIAARIYARREGVPLEKAVAFVRNAHPDSKIKPSLLSADTPNKSRSNISRVAVSGGRGFVGSRVCEQLVKNEYECLSLTRGEHGDYLGTSNRLKESLRGFDPDLIIHLAHPKPYNSEASLQVALSQMISVANFCEENGVLLMYPSSWVVFDGLSDSEVTRESRVGPHTRYGRLKTMIEAYLMEAAKESLTVRILRLPGLFGDDSLEPRFLRYFADCKTKGDKIVFHVFENGSARVPLVHVDAGANALVHAIKGFRSLPLISHVGTSARSPSVQEIATRFAESTGILARATPVQRTAFTGYFVPDIHVPDGDSLAAGINNFILQLCRESHVKR